MEVSEAQSLADAVLFGLHPAAVGSLEHVKDRGAAGVFHDLDAGGDASVDLGDLGSIVPGIHHEADLAEATPAKGFEELDGVFGHFGLVHGPGKAAGASIHGIPAVGLEGQGIHGILLVVHHDIAVAHVFVLGDELLDDVFLRDDIAVGDVLVQLLPGVDLFKACGAAALSGLGGEGEGDSGEEIIHGLIVHFGDGAGNAVLHAGCHGLLFVVGLEEGFTGSRDDLELRVEGADLPVGTDVRGFLQDGEKHVVAVLELLFDCLAVDVDIFPDPVDHDPPGRISGSKTDVQPGFAHGGNFTAELMQLVQKAGDLPSVSVEQEDFFAFIS